MLLSDIALVERVPVLDVVVTDLIDVQHLGGGVYRFTFATRYRDPVTFEATYEVRAQLVMAAPAVFRAAIWALRAIGARCCGSFVMDRCSLH